MDPFSGTIAVIVPGDRFLAFIMVFMQSFLYKEIEYKEKRLALSLLATTKLLEDYSGKIKTSNVNHFK